MRFDGSLVLVPIVKTSVTTWDWWMRVDMPRHNGRGKGITVDWDEGREAAMRRNMI